MLEAFPRQSDHQDSLKVPLIVATKKHYLVRTQPPDAMNVFFL
jgi:hypothetical protein